jgi:hypothetical protein
MLHDKQGYGGFFRLQITEPTKEGQVKVVGDSGWHKNMITNAGAQQFIVEKMTGGGSLVSSAALGSGGTVASTMTSLPAEVAVAAGRFAVAGAVSASRTLRFTGSLQSNVLASTTVGNVGLFAVSTTGAGTMFAGNTFASSTLATNQAVNLTYDIQFPTT